MQVMKAKLLAAKRAFTNFCRLGLPPSSIAWIARAFFSAFVVLMLSAFSSPRACGQETIDLGTVTERHKMVPMRDGNSLSAYLYFPPGSGPWPVVFEQRYADLRGASTRKAAARLAEAGYVV